MNEYYFRCLNCGLEWGNEQECFHTCSVTKEDWGSARIEFLRMINTNGGVADKASEKDSF